MESGIPGFVRRFHDCLVECARSRDRDMERLRRGADRAAADLAELDDILRAYDRPAIDRRRQEAILVERDAFLEDSSPRQPV